MTAQEYIHKLGRFSGKAGLHRIRALLTALGDPQKQLQFVHIAGTNGKGSTATMLASMVRAAGYRVGLFTSPYLICFHERIRVDDTMISQQALDRLTDKVREATQTVTLPEGESIGEFEFITAVALLYFVEQACDLVVLEAGLGGEFDATNAIDAPIAAVLTSISLDHTQVLGDSVEKIAQAKTGIIKSSSTVVIMPHQPEEAYRVITRACRKARDSLIVPGEAEEVVCTLSGTSFRYQGTTYHMNFAGRHQLNNALVAIHVADALRQNGFGITVSAVQQGLAQARMRGRLETVCKEPLILLDGAHNPDGVAALCAALDELLGERTLFVVLGMVQDKAVAPCVQALAKRAAKVFATAPENERALAPEKLGALAQQDCTDTQICANLLEALSQARAQASEQDCILVCGSLYLVGECKRILQDAPETTK